MYWKRTYFSFYGSSFRSISASVSSVGIPVGIGSSTAGIDICAITAAIKKYKTIIKKKVLLVEIKVKYHWNFNFLRL